MLKNCTLEEPLELVTDWELHELINKSMMGGLSCIFQPSAKANTPELDDYDPTQPDSCIAQLDVNSMYPAVMTQPMPVGGYTKLEPPQDPQERVADLHRILDSVDFNGEEETVGYMVTVDYEIPIGRHDEIDWAPPTSMIVGPEALSPHSWSILLQNDSKPTKTRKLVPFLGPHHRETLDAKRLRFLRDVLGVRVTAFHGGWSFRCRPFMREFTRQCYALRREYKRRGLKVMADVIKLVMNAIYGKTVQDKSRCRNANLYTDPRAFEIAQASLRAVDYSIRFADDGGFMGVVHTVKGRGVVANTPRCVGWRVLELSRLMMLRYHYHGVKRLFPDARLLMTDTDSAMYHFACSHTKLWKLLGAANLTGDVACVFDVLGDSKNADRDLAMLSPEERATAVEVNGQLGALADEFYPNFAKEYIGLRAKVYAVLCAILLTMEEVAKLRGKGIPEKALKEMGFGDYRDVLESGAETKTSFYLMRCRAHQIFVERVDKKALSSLNDKVWQISATESRPHGHWRNACGDLLKRMPLDAYPEIRKHVFSFLC
jgi:hypothetical protein